MDFSDWQILQNDRMYSLMNRTSHSELLMKFKVCSDKFYGKKDPTLWQSWCHMGQLHPCNVMDYKVQQAVYISTDHTHHSVVDLTALGSFYRFCSVMENVTDSTGQRISDRCGLYSIMGSTLLWTLWLRVLQPWWI